MIRKELKDITVEEIVNMSYDQVYISFPAVFPLVDIAIESTDGLYKLANIARIENGYKPISDEDEAWYSFYIAINGYTDSHVDGCIDCVPGGEFEEDDDVFIELSAEECEYIYQQLNKQIDCENLLRECADYWKEDRGELTILDRRTI